MGVGTAPQGRLSWEEVCDIRCRVAEGQAPKDVAVEYGCSDSLIRRIVRYQRYRSERETLGIDALPPGPKRRVNLAHWRDVARERRRPVVVDLSYDVEVDKSRPGAAVFWPTGSVTYGRVAT